MSITETEVLTYYLTTLAYVINEDDPTLYNSLFQLRKYYQTHGSIVPENHKQYLVDLARSLLDSQYDDYLEDNEEIDFEDFINIWITLDKENCYGGNGTYDIHGLAVNTLKDILNMCQSLNVSS